MRPRAFPGSGLRPAGAAAGKVEKNFSIPTGSCVLATPPMGRVYARALPQAARPRGYAHARSCWHCTPAGARGARLQRGVPAGGHAGACGVSVQRVPMERHQARAPWAEGTAGSTAGAHGVRLQRGDPMGGACRSPDAPPFPYVPLTPHSGGGLYVAPPLWGEGMGVGGI